MQAAYMQATRRPTAIGPFWGIRQWGLSVTPKGHYCRCQQIWTRDLIVESLWSYPLSHDSSFILPLKALVNIVVDRLKKK